MKAKQKIFNKVYRHLMQQGKQSLSDYGTRRVIRSTILARALGCLIDDTHYNKNLEGRNIYSIDVKRAFERSNPSVVLDLQMIDLLIDLQNMHDNPNFKIDGIDFWTEGLACIASEHGLKIPQTKTG